MVESKSQMKYFIAVALDFPQNRLGQVHLAHMLSTALPIFFYQRQPKGKTISHVCT